jgi:hypothetical protein
VSGIYCAGGIETYLRGATDDGSGRLLTQGVLQRRYYLIESPLSDIEAMLTKL